MDDIAQSLYFRSLCVTFLLKVFMQKTKSQLKFDLNFETNEEVIRRGTLRKRFKEKNQSMDETSKTISHTIDTSNTTGTVTGTATGTEIRTASHSKFTTQTEGYLTFQRFEQIIKGDKFERLNHSFHLFNFNAGGKQAMIIGLHFFVVCHFYV